MSEELVVGQNLVVLGEGVVVRDSTQVVAINHAGGNIQSILVVNLLRSGCPMVQVVLNLPSDMCAKVLYTYKRQMKSLEVVGETFKSELWIGKEVDDLHIIMITRTVDSD